MLIEIVALLDAAVERTGLQCASALESAGAVFELKIGLHAVSIDFPFAHTMAQKRGRILSYHSRAFN